MLFRLQYKADTLPRQAHTCADYSVTAVVNPETGLSCILGSADHGMRRSSLTAKSRLTAKASLSRERLGCLVLSVVVRRLLEPADGDRRAHIGLHPDLGAGKAESTLGLAQELHRGSGGDG